jgi:hypothetical protein
MTSLAANDVVQGSSVAGIVKNALFSLGYLLIPLEQKTALALTHQPVMLASVAVLAIVLLWIFTRSIDKPIRARLLFPLFFLVCTGVPSWLVFERWRLYLPSVGAVMILILIASAMLRRGGASKVIALSLASLFILFHVYRSIASTIEWQRSTALMQRVEQDMKAALATIPQRPVRLMLITSPAKLGSAGVLLLGAEAIGQQAEAERLYAPGLLDGLVDTNSVKVEEAIQVYALNADHGFQGLDVTSLGNGNYRVEAPLRSGMKLVPTGLGMGALRHDLALRAGDTLDNIIVRRYERTIETERIEFSLRDTLVTPLVFDGAHVRRLK